MEIIEILSFNKVAGFSGISIQGLYRDLQKLYQMNNLKRLNQLLIISLMHLLTADQHRVNI